MASKDYKYAGLPTAEGGAVPQSPTKSFGSFIFFLYERFTGYIFFTVLTLVGLFHFLYGVILWPIKIISPTLFRKGCSFVFKYSVPGFLCVPFSWCRAKCVVNNTKVFSDLKNDNALILANHNARIDWMMGLYIGSIYGQRVSFVTEAFIMILPIIGWFRYIAEDMFVFRSFKQDKERMEKNINDFHNSNVTRWVFLCPEGAIVDFSKADKQYVKDCNKFCESLGLDPFEMVLTPRYKGLQCFNKIVTGGRDMPADDISVTMTYTQRGEKLSKPLKNDNRIIPDLWALLKGQLECHVNTRKIKISNDAETMKTQIMQDYAVKDKLLKHFWVHGHYPEDVADGVPESHSSPYVPLSTPHVQFNLSLFGQFAMWLGLLHYLDALVVAYYLSITIYCIIVISHVTGEFLANGQSRESIPFEGITKAILFRMIGREGSDDEQATKNTKEPKVEKIETFRPANNPQHSMGLDPEPECDIPIRDYDTVTKLAKHTSAIPNEGSQRLYS